MENTKENWIAWNWLTFAHSLINAIQMDLFWSSFEINLKLDSFVDLPIEY